MADRRSDDSPVAPPRSLSGPGSASGSGAKSRSGSAKAGRGTAYDPDATGRSEPVLPPPPEEKPKSKGAEKIAAIVAASKSGDTSKSAPTRVPPRRVRRARLRLTHVDPWSIMKTSFLLSIALGIVTVVAVAIVWTVLGAAGVWDSIDSTVGDVVGESSSTFSIQDYLGMSRVMGFTMIIAVVDVVLVTVIATLGAFLYNLAAALLGGIEVVLAEEEH